MKNSQVKAISLAGIFTLAVILAPVLSGVGQAWAEPRERGGPEYQRGREPNQGRPESAARQHDPRMERGPEAYRGPSRPGRPDPGPRNYERRSDDYRQPPAPPQRRAPDGKPGSVDRRINEQRHGYEHAGPGRREIEGPPPRRGGPEHVDRGHNPGYRRPPDRTPRRDLPARYRPFDYRGKRYFHDHGEFYELGPLGYFLVTAPLGALFNSLGDGYDPVVVSGQQYYYQNGTYFKRVPNGYVVVEPPVSQVYSSGYVRVKPELLNVRSGPSRNDSVVVIVRENAELEVRGQQGSWLYIKTPYGKFGWVHSDYVEPIYSGSSG